MIPRIFPPADLSTATEAYRTLTHRNAEDTAYADVEWYRDLAW